MMNYHELTMTEARDSPQRRRQFLVICTIMAGCMGYACLNAGILESVTVAKGEFKGGEVIYKLTSRDYAAAPGMARHIGGDLGWKRTKKNDSGDLLYTFYLDDPRKVSGRDQRFAVGWFGDNQEIKEQLLKTNDGRVLPTAQDEIELPAAQWWPKLNYERRKLPKTSAMVAQFPFTDGFVSALILQYKVLPALRVHGSIIVSTCSVDDQMCTHYAISNKQYLLGQPNSETYQKSLPDTPLFDFDLALANIQKMIPFIGSSSKTDKEEL